LGGAVVGVGGQAGEFGGDVEGFGDVGEGQVGIIFEEAVEGLVGDAEELVGELRVERVARELRVES
jgi:hypothetical protein